MQIIIYTYYFLRSLLLRGLYNTIKLLRAELRNESFFRINTARIKRSSSSEFFHYQGASYLVLFKIFSEMDKKMKSYDFVDIGSGKGRVVYVAEYYGFNSLIGIELDDALVNDANNNAKLYPYKRPESKIEFIHTNALEYGYKDRPTVYFLFNPFNREIMEKVLDKILSSGKSEIWFVYMNPLYRTVFERKELEHVKTFKTRFYTEAVLYKTKK